MVWAIDVVWPAARCPHNTHCSHNTHSELGGRAAGAAKADTTITAVTYKVNVPDTRSTGIVCDALDGLYLNQSVAVAHSIASLIRKNTYIYKVVLYCTVLCASPLLRLAQSLQGRLPPSRARETQSLGISMSVLPKVAGGLALATATRYFTLLSAVAFHNSLRLAVEDGKDGLIVAFLDEQSPNHAAEAATFNDAARSWRCVPAGGVHVMLTGVDDRARFLAGDLQYIYGLPPDAVPPIALFFRNEKPESWIATNSSSRAAAAVRLHVVDGDGGDGGIPDLAFTLAGLEDWGNALFNVKTVRSKGDVDALRSGSDFKGASIGFFPRACEGRGLIYHQALSALRGSDQIGSIGGMLAAVSSNMTLGHELCSVDSAEGGVCFVIGTQGAQLTLPDQVPYTTDGVSGWLRDIAGLEAASPQDKSEL